ncbi:DUF2267 domain-containing protein [Halopelagius longus]|uniref:DUF2267 domain-containing protein n=1 Tax=Halopelagius longus TaxID=1236180 RepID=A0A1H1FH81_9EURY|nr:DUF2267 domain-containing protein [Halopelagius longus]RDI70221.1 DUF2267 domain-containing protein [Halopelagius longus]SDR00089.1 Uncharacterized conserved protein, DUF2267 family [Halopelagius longus]
MDYDSFLGQVQNELELSSTGEAARATRAVLTTLGERLEGGEASDLAAPLPMEIDRFLLEAESGQQFDYDEFVDRVVEREGEDRSEAAYHAQAVLDVVSETVPEGELEEVKAQLPPEYEDLFEVAERATDGGQ